MDYNKDIIPPVSDEAILSRFGKQRDILKHMNEGKSLSDAMKAAEKEANLPQEQPQIVQENQVYQQQPQYNEYGEKELPSFDELKEIMRSRLKESKLPKAVLDTYQDSTDELVNFKLDPNQQMPYTAQSLMNESKTPAPHQNGTPSINRQPSGIDYELIKNIVETVVERKLSEYLEDSGQQLKRISIGDKFQFITNDGNLYDAQLTYRKNVKKR